MYQIMQLGPLRLAQKGSTIELLTVAAGSLHMAFSQIAPLTLRLGARAPSCALYGKVIGQ